MPVYESACTSPACAAYGDAVERFEPHYTEQDPRCVACGGPTRRVYSVFRSPLMGKITARYNDRSLENAHQDGHWAFERNTPDGKPRPVFIETFEQQREFCKREGLVNPADVGNAEVSEDGRRYQTRGMKGQWV